MSKLRKYYSKTGATIYSISTGKSAYQLPLQKRVKLPAKLALFLSKLTLFFTKTVLDPRLKLQYHKDQSWEQHYIEEAKQVVIETYRKNYVLPQGSRQSPDEYAKGSLLSHIYYSRKRKRKPSAEELPSIDELTIYLASDHVILLEGMEVLNWWRVGSLPAGSWLVGSGWG